MDTTAAGRPNVNTFTISPIGSGIAVISSTHIPADVSTLPLISKLSLERVFETKSSNQYLLAYVSQMGILCVDQHLNWIQFVRIARNCFEQNLTAIPSNNSSALVLKTIKNISKGEELLVWPSPELMSLMNIPFLTPKNIVNDHCYQCHRCGHSFSQPNPLKVHLTIECTVIRNSVTKVEQNFIEEHRISKDIETKTSTVQRGHTCLYCGKNYTRKYGLKIHERTHTGQKPLRCSFCGRPFSDPSNLNKHIRLHSQHNSIHSNPYKCKICSKVLIRRRDLERHIKSRHQSI